MNNLKKQLYQLIKKNETVFDFIQEEAVNGLWFWDLENTSKKWVNPAFCDALGYEINCIDANILLEIVYEKDRQTLEDIYVLLADGNTIRNERILRFYHIDGSIVWFSFSFLIIKNKDEETTHFIVGHKEVTHKNVNDLINRYESILNNNSTFIIRTDMEGKYTYVNDYFCNYFGLDKTEVIGQNSMDSIMTEDHNICSQVVEKCLKNPNESFFCKIRKPLQNNKIAYTEWEYKAIINQQNIIEEIQCVGIDITERVEAEKKEKKKAFQLARIQKMLKTCNENTKIGIWELDLKTHFSKWDKIVKQIHEVDDDFIADAKLGISFYKKEDQKRIEKYVALAIHEGKNYDDIFQLETYKGNKIWVRATGVPTMSENNTCLELYGTFQDITQQVEAEKKLQDKISELEKAQQEIKSIQTKLSTTLEKTGIGLWELDLNTQELFWDNQTKKIFDIGVNEKVDRPSVRARAYKEDLEKIDEYNELITQGKINSYEIQYRITSLQGETIHLDTKAISIRDENNNPSHIVGIIQDITQQKKHEAIIQKQNKELAQSEKELRKGIRKMYHLQQDLENQRIQIEQIFDAVPAMIYQFRRDKEGKISFPLVSKGSETILGVKPKHILDNSSNDIFEAIHPDDLLGFQSSVQKSSENMQKWESELRLMKNNKEVWIHATSKPTHMDDGGIVWTGIMQNIDHIKDTEFRIQEQNKQLITTLEELQETQSQLIHNEKMTTLGQLVASIAHEINTPLGAIHSSSGSIKKMLQSVLINLPTIIKKFSEKQLDGFGKLIDISANSNNLYSSREKRNLKYDLIAKLESKNIPQADRIADILVDTGLHEEKELFEGFVMLPNSLQIFEAIYEISTIVQSNILNRNWF